MAYSISKENAIKPSTGSSAKLEDGAYAATIVGYMVSKQLPMNEDDESKKFDAIKFALQLVDDDGADKVVYTKDWRISLSERSTLFKQISSWCKSASPDDLWDRLEKAKFMNEEGNLDFDKFLAKKVQLMVTMKASKKDPSKLYPEFTFTPPKAKAQHEVKLSEEDKIPLWISKNLDAEDFVDSSCIEGFEWKRYEKKEDGKELETQTPAQSKGAPKKVVKTATPGNASEATEVSDDTLPF